MQWSAANDDDDDDTLVSSLPATQPRPAPLQSVCKLPRWQLGAAGPVAGVDRHQHYRTYVILRNKELAEYPINILRVKKNEGWK